MGLKLGDLQVFSPAFQPRGRIPTRYTREGEDLSPPLRWTGVPEGTRELVVVCHDPDAPMPDGFTHWVAYGIPPSVEQLPEDCGQRFDQLVEGDNDFGETGYGGPLPPEGHGIHHYYFWVYALGAALDAKPGLGRPELLSLAEEHILEQNRVVGTYER